MTKKIRIFIGFEEIAGYNTNLQEGFHDLGYECRFVNESRHPFGYQGGKPVLTERLLQYLHDKYNRANNSLKKYLFLLLIGAIHSILLLHSIPKYEVFIFSYGKSFLLGYDLPLLKFFHKKIIFVFMGSDSRPPYIDGCIMGPGKEISLKECVDLSQAMKRRITRLEKYAHVLIDNPAAGHFHERRFIQGLIMGIPFKMNNSSAGSLVTGESHPNPGVVRLLHSPSDPIAKGTGLIRSAVSRLESEGFSINYREIINQPHERVLQALSESDLIIDQCFSDTPMAMLATEAAWFGKPSLVGSYYSEMIHEDTPERYIPPSYFCHPDELGESLRFLIQDKEYRLDLGRRAKNYVDLRLKPSEVAKRYIRLIYNDIPEDWYFDPEDISYLTGSGLDESRVKAIVRNIIQEYGRSALHLSDKPLLERKFFEFAMSKE